jgi:hypothetical protein
MERVRVGPATGTTERPATSGATQECDAENQSVTGGNRTLSAGRTEAVEVCITSSLPPAEESQLLMTTN